MPPSKFIPPLLPRLLLKLQLRGDEYFEIADDLSEIFRQLVKNQGRFRASLWYWLRVMESVPSNLWEKAMWRTAMLRNYIKIAFRNMARQKQYSAINIVGLAVGMACCLLIYVYVAYELSYDGYHPDADRIYRATMHLKIADSDFYTASAPEVMAAALKQDYPEVAQAGWVYPKNGNLVEAEGSLYSEDRLVYVDNNFFDLFSVDFVEGGPRGIIDRTRTILLTEDMAEKFFGFSDPMGKAIRINRQEYEITGILKNSPANTHLRYNFLTSLSNFGRELTDWNNFTGSTYIKLEPGADRKIFQEKIRWIVHTQTGEPREQGGSSIETVLEPLRRLNLHSKADARNSMLMIYSISLIGFLILLIACLNFVNLSTSRASARAKEVAVRKVAGAGQSQLVHQFIGESLSLAVTAFLLSVLAAVLALPSFSRLVERELDAGLLLLPANLLFVLMLILVVGVPAGGYPAFFLSRLKPASILTHRFSSGSRKSTLRKSFVFIQFAVTTILIVATLTVFNQLRFMKNRYLGFEKEQKLIVSANVSRVRETIKSEFLNHPDILGVTASDSVPGGEGTIYLTSTLEAEPIKIEMEYYIVDQDFVPEYKIHMAAGGNFDHELNTDLEGVVIINETAMKLLGWSTPEEALGKSIGVGGSSESRKKIICGVIEDFHYKGLQNKIGALGLIYNSRSFKTLSLRVSTENLSETLSFVERYWNRLFPREVFSFRFLDESFDRLYSAEEQVGKIFTTFTILAIFLSGLGLFSLSSFIAAQRTKEIGVRKVLGATVPKILSLISREFILILLLANLIAWPVSYLIMKNWLGNFAYRIDLTFAVFIFSTVIGMVIALTAISYQSLKAALADPVNSLRYE